MEAPTTTQAPVEFCFVDWTPENGQDSTLRITKYRLSGNRLIATEELWTDEYHDGEIIEVDKTAPCSPGDIKELCTVLRAVQQRAYYNPIGGCEFAYWPREYKGEVTLGTLYTVDKEARRKYGLCCIEQHVVTGSGLHNTKRRIFRSRQFKEENPWHMEFAENTAYAAQRCINGL